MINRSRCRAWSPLATQQLRLRNLVKITGHNIESDANTSIYFTLHLTLQSAPFFTSEPIKTTKNAIWSDIDCQNLEKTTSPFVVVRVWQRKRKLCVFDQINFRRSSIDSLSISKTEINNNLQIPKIDVAVPCTPNDHDAILFTWKVYFSGLVPITRHSDVKFAKDALVFHIYRGFFTSADYLLAESTQSQFNFFHRTILEQKNMLSLDDDSEAEHNDPNRLKVRYFEYEFPKNDARHSYNLQKLLKLQEIQRMHRKELISCCDIKKKIFFKPAFCSNAQHAPTKRILPTHNRNSSIGRTLSRLLIDDLERPTHETLLKAQELRRKIEAAKFRCCMLAMERDKHKIQLQNLREKCNKLGDEDIDREASLIDSNRDLNRNRDMIIELKSIIENKSKISKNVTDTLMQLQCQRLAELKEIFSIEKCSESNLYKINGIHLPNSNALRAYGFDSSQISHTPVSLSVAMGHAAQIVLFCSTILNIPLRNKIIYYGSASRIRDDVKKLPENSREFPLFCRNMPPSDALLYGTYLLNQNILQLKFMLGMDIAREDFRSTLKNLLDILSIDRMATTSNAVTDSVSNTIMVEDINELPIAAISNTSIDITDSNAVTKDFAHSTSNVSGTHFNVLRRSASF